MSNRAKIAAEAKLEGKFLLETSNPEISAEDAALGYKNLLEAERSFRDSRARCGSGRSSTTSKSGSAPMS